jgi:hypothetical protein
MARYCPKCGAQFGTEDETCPRCSFDPNETDSERTTSTPTAEITPTEGGSKKAGTSGKSPLVTLFWLIALAGALVGGGVAIAGINSAHSAPQEAAAAGMAVAVAVIPYVLARAVQELASTSRT